MSAQSPSIEELGSYCTANQRVVPMPQERLMIHLRWTEQQNQLTEVSAFLRGLTEDCWLHFHEA